MNAPAAMARFADRNAVAMARSIANLAALAGEG